MLLGTELVSFNRFRMFCSATWSDRILNSLLEGREGVRSGMIIDGLTSSIVRLGTKEVGRGMSILGNLWAFGGSSKEICVPSLPRGGWPEWEGCEIGTAGGSKAAGNS